MTDREPYRDDVRDALARAGWTEDAHGALVAPNGALWAETSPALDSCMDAHDSSWTLACDSDVPATVIVAAALAAAGQNEPDIAGKVTRKGESTLSSDVLDLLAAIRDMANVPLPGLADADERAWQSLMSRRLSELHAALDVALSPQWTDTLDPANDAAHLRKRLAEMPVTYALYEPDGARQGDEAPVPAHEDEPEPDNPPRRAAREIQALHDPAVIGYVICVAALRLTLRPTEWAQWQAWQKRLSVEPGSTTYLGGTATAHGKWGDVPVVVSCYLDRVPKSPPVEIAAAPPATARVPGLCPPCKRGDCDECMAVDHPYLPGLYTCHYVPNPHEACRQARRGGERP